MNWLIRNTGYDFLEPNWFYLLLLLPVFIVALFYLERRQFHGVVFTKPEVSQRSIQSTFIRRLRQALFVLKTSFFLLVVLALAHPFSWDNQQQNDDINGVGIDILFVLDVSESMQAMDLKPNRLNSAKKVIEQFIGYRKNDRIGLVAYAGEAYSACPKTTDHGLLLEQLDRVNGAGMVPGTAIGIGLGTAVAQLKGDSTESKAIILLTDGTNNRGDLTPIEAAGLAKDENIRVYCIGVGTNGFAPMPDSSPFGMGYFYAPVEIDEQVLEDISEITGAKYFRATNSKSLEKVISEIDKIEKKRIKMRPDIQASIPFPEFLLTSILILSILLFSIDFFLFKGHE